MQTTNASITEKAARKAECIIVVNTEDANIHLDQIQTPIRTLEGLFLALAAPLPRFSPTAVKQLLVDSGLF